jgi:riboflavin transporter FmnP
MNRVKLLVTAGMLAGLSVLLQVSPLFVETPWGMQVDLVAVPWLVASMFLGLFGGLATSSVSALVIALVAKTGWIGALMKFVATLPLVAAIGLARLKSKNPGLKIFLVAFAGAVVARALLAIALNYYFAMPIWLGKTTEELFAVIPLWWIYLPNTIQSVLEFSVAWLLVFRTKLKGKIE